MKEKINNNKKNIVSERSKIYTVDLKFDINNPYLFLLKKFLFLFLILTQHF